MKNENAKKIIIIALVVLVAIVGVVLIINLTSSSETLLNNEVYESETRTKYINVGAASKDKIAVVYDLKGDTTKRSFVITIDDVGAVSKFEEGIRETAKSYYNLKICGMEINTLNEDEGGWFNPNKDIKYGINLKSEPLLPEKVIYEDGDWYLTKGNFNGVYYNIYYKFDLGNNEEFHIANPRVNTEEEAKEALDECKKNVKMYYVDNESDSYITVIDKDNNKVDLREYTFANDILAKEIEDKGLEIRSPIEIVGAVKDSFQVVQKITGEDDVWKNYVIDMDSVEEIKPEDIEEEIKVNEKTIIVSKFDNFYKKRSFVVKGKNGDVRVDAFISSEDSKEILKTKYTITKQDFIDTFIKDEKIENQIIENEQKTEKNVEVKSITGKTLVDLYKEGTLKVGDKVNYEPDVVTESYNPDGTEVGSKTGYTKQEQQIKQEELIWVVMGYDEVNNKILLVARNTTTEELTFFGHIGYNNYQEVVNNVCKTLYSKNGIGNARSITLNDVNNYLDGNTVDIINQEVLKGFEETKYGYKQQVTDVYHPEQWDGKWSGELETTGYTYLPWMKIKNDIKEDILTSDSKRYFIADKGVYGGSWDSGFCVFKGGNELGTEWGEFCDTYGRENKNSSGMKPVIELQSSVTDEQVQIIK